MRYHNLFESTSNFILHPALDPEKYIITDSFSQVSRWRTYIYENSNGGDLDVGEMDEVGYVMISKTNNTIIPIARGDEHHRGYDLLYDLSDGSYKKKGKPLNIDTDDYIPIWCHGNNYLYDKSEIPDLLNVLKKYLSYGGKDGFVIGANDFRKLHMTTKDFVASNGIVTIQQGSLASIGQRVYTMFHSLGKLINDNRNARIPSKKAFADALSLIKFLIPISYELGVSYDFLKEVTERIVELRKENDIQGLENLIFDFHGLKNTVHSHLKKIAKDKNNAWQMDKTVAIWGDVDLAIDMLSRV